MGLIEWWSVDSNQQESLADIPWLNNMQMQDVALAEHTMECKKAGRFQACGSGPKHVVSFDAYFSLWFPTPQDFKQDHGQPGGK